MSENDTNLMIRIEELDEALEIKVEEIKKIIQKKKEILVKVKDEEVRNEILKKLSHGLRTPLNSILGFAELLLENSYGKLDNQQVEVVSDIKESADDLLKGIILLLEVHQKRFKSYDY